MIKSFYNIIFAVCFAMAIPFRTFSQFGGLDNTFDSDGNVITDISGFADVISDVIVQQDGKIVVCGHSLFIDPDEGDIILLPEVARYNSNGLPDPTFNGNGLLVFTDGAYANAYFTTVNQTSDGKLLFFGNKLTDWLMIRTNADGTMDNSFGGNGDVITDIAGNSDFAHSLIIQPDGKMVAVGQSLIGFFQQPVVIRYLSDGTLDASFGNGGIVQINDGATGSFNSVKLQIDGKIVAAGHTTDQLNGHSIFFIMRFNSDGTVDNTFGTSGRVKMTFPESTNQYINSISLQADKKIVAAGNTYVPALSACVARFNEDGSLDSSFEDSGKQAFSWGLIFSGAEDCLVQPDGKIVLTGYASDELAHESLVMMRLQTNGKADSTFGTNGLAYNNFSGIAVGNCSAIQQDGKLIAAGENGDDACLARYLSGLTGINSPQSDPSFAMQVFPNPAESIVNLSYSLPQSLQVNISLMNNIGEEVMTLFSGFQPAGMQKVNVTIPQHLAPGMYYCHLQTSLISSMQPLLIAK